VNFLIGLLLYGYYESNKIGSILFLFEVESSDNSIEVKLVGLLIMQNRF